MDMPRIEEFGADIAAFYRDILDGKRSSSTCHEVGHSLMAFAPLPNRDWILLVILERDNGR
jgi:hypothetical protein